MRFILVFAYIVFVFSGIAVSAGDVFVPTEEQLNLLKEGQEQVKYLEEQYSRLSMEGTTERCDWIHPAGERRSSEHFRFHRRGYEYCLLDQEGTFPHTKEDKPDEFRSCYLITPKGRYNFSEKGNNSPPTFVLTEVKKFDNHDLLVNTIDYVVHSNWDTGAAPYSMAVDLSCPFDLDMAKSVSPRQGGYIKGITEKNVEGKRVVTLQMGYYYYENDEANGSVSFYPDHYWAVKDAMVECVREDTQQICDVYKIINEYNLSETFPKLVKSTIETWDPECKQLQDSAVTTITNIDFTEPDLSVFDTKRFSAKSEDKLFVLPKTSISPWRIAGIVFGIILIIWGICIGIFGKKDQS